ncbi:MAG: hypothetical protein ACRDVE_00805, partial [Actinocrinis sp.]
RFQRGREASVNASREIQLRQERAFALSGPVQVALRKLAYRLVDRSDYLKRRLMTGVYYGLQTAVLSGKQTLDLKPPAPTSAAPIATAPIATALSAAATPTSTEG